MVSTPGKGEGDTPRPILFLSLGFLRGGGVAFLFHSTLCSTVRGWLNPVCLFRLSFSFHMVPGSNLRKRSRPVVETRRDRQFLFLI